MLLVLPLLLLLLLSLLFYQHEVIIIIRDWVYTTVSLFTLFTSNTSFSIHSSHCLCFHKRATQYRVFEIDIDLSSKPGWWAHEMSNRTGGLEALRPLRWRIPQTVKQEAEQAMSFHAPSDRRVTQCSQGEALLGARRHSSFGRSPSPSCQIHKLAFSLLICDAQESLFSDEILEGPVFFSIHRGGHTALELCTQSLYFIKRHLFDCW